MTCKVLNKKKKNGGSVIPIRSTIPAPGLDQSINQSPVCHPRIRLESLPGPVGKRAGASPPGLTVLPLVFLVPTFSHLLSALHHSLPSVAGRRGARRRRRCRRKRGGDNSPFQQGLVPPWCPAGSGWPERAAHLGGSRSSQSLVRRPA